MKKRFLLAFAASLLALSFMQAVSAEAATKVYVVNNAYTPTEETLFTDVPLDKNGIIRVNEHDDRNIVNGVANAKIHQWESDIQYVMKAPELLIYFDGGAPMDMEFDIKLTNLSWYFRSVDEKEKSLYCDGNYSGGIEKLLPMSYNKYKGTFKPDDVTGIGGIYTRTADFENEGELSYQLILKGDTDNTATIKLLNGAKDKDYIRIPLVTRLQYYANGSVEIFADKGKNVTPGIYTVLRSETGVNSPVMDYSTTTGVPIPQISSYEISIPEILIKENLYSSLENGSFMLTAPEGYAILPDVDSSLLKKIDRHTLEMKDEDGNYIIDVTLGGHLKWKDYRGNYYQEGAEHGKDITLYYRNPSGVYDTSRLVIDIGFMNKTKLKEYGSISIKGLKLSPIEEPIPGDLYINISPYLGLKGLHGEDFLAGTIVSAGSGENSGYLTSFNIDSLSVEELINTPQFKARTYIKATEGNLNPEAIVTRGQLCEMIYNLLADNEKTYTHEFSDVKNSPYENAIAFCAEKNYISGYGNGNFSPNGNITRGEFAVIMNNILQLNAKVQGFDSVEKDHFAYEALKQLVNAGIMQGYEDNDLGIDNLINKQEAVAMINRAFGRGSEFTSAGLEYNDMPETHWAYGYMMNAVCGFIVN